MLRIRPEQMAVFRQVMAERFKERTLTRLRDDFPKHTAEYSDEGLSEIIYLGVERAKQYGIRIEPDISCFIEHMLLCGTEFDTQLKWAQDILNDDTIAGSEKAYRLEERRLFGPTGRSQT